MKNLIKGLSALAIAATLGLNTMTVNAATTCEEGEVEHTNYYMFLNVETVKYITDGINNAPAGKYFSLYNGADKVNDVPRDKKLDDNYVKITDGSKSTTSSNTNISWTVTEFWQKYHQGYSNMSPNTYVYEDTSKNESYFFHNEWIQYKDETFTEGESRYHATDAGTTALMEYLNSNISSIGSSPLVTRGTALPEAYITVPNSLGSTTASPLRWNIARAFKSSNELVEGIELNGQKRIYSPAAYYVKYCKAGSGTTTPKDPVKKEKKITYDKNTTDMVVSMPVPNPLTFTETCEKISSSTPARTGYQFLGWSTNKDATTPDSKYAPGADYCEDRDNITLYAIWKPVETNPDGSYTVTYDANGGKDAPAPQVSPTGSCLNISTAKPTLAGNNFLGWSTNKNAKEPDPTYAAGAEYCGDLGNITLYAIWQPQTGISAHFIAFSIIAIVAGVALAIAQKKDLFKQI